jgi:molybdopterin molybdotransferase
MLTVEQALAQVLAGAEAIPDVETVPTLHACGRVLATGVVSAMNVPPMDNSQMDGYAVRTLDVPAVPTTLRVSQRIAAGHVGTPLEPGTAARIFTGAPVPPGADAIVMQESCRADGDKVTINERPAIGAWVRRAGLDVEAGQTVLATGARLRPQDLGLAASVGVGELTVYRRLRVAVFFSGDELVMPGEPLPHGRIYNSNRFVLRGLLEKLGCEVLDLGIVPDDRQRTRDAFARAAVGADLIVTSGGVSVGEEDHIKPAVEAEGRLEMWQIAMKPGKPLAFGHVREVPFLALPGNPVASFVTFLLFARPFILRRQGVIDVNVRVLTLAADFDLPQADKRREFLRARMNERGALELFGNQNSAVLSSAVWADGLIDNPPGQPIRRGDAVRFLPYSELLA